MTPANDPAPADEVSDPTARRGHVLLVEDNATNRLVATRMLAKLGYEVDVAEHGGEALDATATTEYDAVLMDCQMPEMDGYQATAAIRRRDEGGRHVPIVAMTAAAMEGDREACLAAGMDDYIAKPVRLETLAATLERWIVPEPVGDAAAVGAVLDVERVDMMRELDDGDGELLRLLVSQFVADAATQLERLHGAVEEGDPEAVAAVAHNLKGASSSVGAVSLAEMCASLEVFARAARARRCSCAGRADDGRARAGPGRARAGRDGELTMRVLAADDDVTCRLVLRATVEKLGHECVVAVDGAEAWREFQARPPDVLITDWMMPGVDGPELCRRVRERDDDGYTYVILATSLERHEHVLEGMEAGADDYLTKPISSFDLRTRLIAARRVTDLHKQVARFHTELERLNAELAIQARTDPLTGLGNRLRLHEQLEAHHSLAARYGRPYALAICDLDDFKGYNDTFGHLDGDEALRRIGRSLVLTSRASDSAFRYGGEEFVVLLPEASAADAILAMERLHVAIEDLAIAHPGSPTGVMTVSIGVAAWDLGCGSDPPALLARADQALYRSKEAGRNRVTAAPREIPTDIPTTVFG